MRGVILAGGTGSRLYPLTAVTNKHLVPVGSLPMIEYPLHTLRKMDVSSVSVVTGGEHFQDIGKYLSEVHPEIDFSFHYQREAGGIAQALNCVKGFVEGEKIAVILGDNIFSDKFYDITEPFKTSEKEAKGAMVFLKEVPDPQRYGVALVGNGKIKEIAEKPKKPKSNLAVTGLYLYDESVFEKIAKLTPSKRRELEITDVNNAYLKDGELDYCLFEGFWSDAGTVKSRAYCEKFVLQGLEKEILSSFSKEIRGNFPSELGQEVL
tara:strand:- start:316 stop:1110 length:795 start_codon:yes stop_codon:yes gene_type:complete